MLQYSKIAVTLLMSCLFYAYPSQAVETDFEFDDWIPNESFGVCAGDYAPPLFPNNQQTDTQITANRAYFEWEGKSRFEGQVLLIQPNRRIRAEKATIETRNGKPFSRIDLVQSVLIEEPHFRLRADTATGNLNQNQFQLQQVQYRWYTNHARGRAEQVLLEGNYRLQLDKATYTPCPPGDNSWSLSADKLVLDKRRGRGVAKHAVLRLKDYPILYLPYFDFPIDKRRKTGFLYPSFTKTNQSGLAFSLPFYWNLAPHYDVTLTPSWQEKRGWGLGAHYRHRTQEHDWKAKGYFLPHDRTYAAFKANNLASHPGISATDPRVLALQTRSNYRYLLAIDHTAQHAPHWQSELQYQTVSDDNYFSDLSQNTYGLDTLFLNQRLLFKYANERLTLEALLQQYKVLHPFSAPELDDAYRKLPEIQLKYANPDIGKHQQIGAHGIATTFSHKPDPSTGLAVTTGERYYLKPYFQWAKSNDFGFLKTRLQAHLLWYRLDLSQQARGLGYGTSPNLAVPIWDADMGLRFWRQTVLNKKTFVQTIEPRLYALWVPYRAQNGLPNFDTGYIPFDYYQLYNSNRFSGFDRVGDTTQLTLGLESHWFTLADYRERFQMGIGQTFYFTNRQVTAANPAIEQKQAQAEMEALSDNRSPIAAQASYFWNAFFRMIGDVEWNVSDKRLDKSSISLQYKPDAVQVFNLGLGFIRRNPILLDPNTQTPERVLYGDTSGVLRVTERLRLLAHFSYDIQNKQSKTAFLGLEYQNCCLGLRMGVLRTLKPYDVQKSTRAYLDKLSFQLIFKGLGKLPLGSTSNLYGKVIPGYDAGGTRF